VILREALGADVLAHFMVKAPVVLTEDVKELAHDVGAEAVEAVERGAQAGESEFMARLNPRTSATKGEEIELVIDVHRMHYFDVETGAGIYGGDEGPQRAQDDAPKPAEDDAPEQAGDEAPQSPGGERA